MFLWIITIFFFIFNMIIEFLCLFCYHYFFYFLLDIFKKIRNNINTMFVDDQTYKRGNKIYRRVLLRHGYRENGKVKLKTIANLSHCSDVEIEAIKLALKEKENIQVLKNLANGNYETGKAVGGVAVLLAAIKALGIDKALGNAREALLVIWLIMSRLLGQGSRLSAVRLANDHAVCEMLGLEPFNEDDLYKAMDWLCMNKDRVEKNLFQDSELSNEHLFLYDITSSYLEGEKNEYAHYGYNRDGKKGKKQIVYGLLTNKDGELVCIEVFPGNTSDCKTFEAQIHALKDRFKCKDITIVGDKGIIKKIGIEYLEKVGFNYITSITKEQIRSMSRKEQVQLGLFDDSLMEVVDGSERYIMRRNPVVASSQSRKREAKINAIRQMLEKSNQYLSGHKRALVEVQLRKITEKIGHYGLEKIIKIEVDEECRSLSMVVDGQMLMRAQELDGVYAIKTNIKKSDMSAEEIHARYKDLQNVERAFRIQKSKTIEVRPIYVRKAERTIGHLEIVMLAYKVERYLSRCWRELNITVREGIHRLCRLVSNIITIGEEKLITVGDPDSECAHLLNLADAIVPKVLPYRACNVNTKKKLNLNRKID
ncbi:MAG TPA: IS1634 family transposase [Candidatus Pacebacteria bacterium]|nr:IS1634 family transposase [Candidatus Paceibacterota bacterium]